MYFKNYLSYVITLDNETKAFENLVYNLHVYYYLKNNNQLPAMAILDKAHERKISAYIERNIELGGTWIVRSIQTIHKNSGNQVFTDLLEKVIK